MKDGVRSVSGVYIRLPAERWRHIVEGHPELLPMRDDVLRSLADPDMIQEGDAGELLAVRFIDRGPAEGKFLVAVYRELETVDGFLLTAYLTRQPASRRKVLWTR